MPTFGASKWTEAVRTHCACTERGARIVDQDLGPFGDAVRQPRNVDQFLNYF